MDPIQIIALTMGIAWASGINLYAAVFMLGFMGSAGYMTLPPNLEILADPLVMIAAGFMYCVEFFADKTPGVDSGWDALHTFIRIPAGAVLAAGAVADVSPAAALAAGLVGGAIAAGSHATKAGTRVMINTSPEPVSNWTASIAEDLAVIGALWTALNYPWVFLALFVLFVALTLWLLPKLWRALKRLAETVRDFLGRRSPAQATSAERQVAAEPPMQVGSENRLPPPR